MGQGLYCLGPTIIFELPHLLCVCGGGGQKKINEIYVKYEARSK